MASEDLPANGHGGPADSAKAFLRQHLRATRAAYVAGLTVAERDAAVKALATVLTAHLPAGLVAGYNAVGSEIDLAALPRPLALPRADRGRPLTFHAARPADCRPGALGIPEPAAGTPLVVPDIVLVPLLGVDPTGARLGYGGGFYDRTLAALRVARPVLAVGVAWDVQVVATLPTDPWDERLDALATPAGWRDFAR